MLRFADTPYPRRVVIYNELSEHSEVLQALIDNGKMENNLELALKINDTMNDLKEKEKHKKLNKLEEKEKEKEKEKNQINKNCDDNFNINSIPIDYKERNIQ